jgi:hypothetical protein
VTKVCVFVGPTRLKKVPRRVHVFEPAALGSVFRAIDEGYKLICLIDGYFGNTPSVWHKEILFALKSGVTVCGSSSIGALRAAELHSFGMLGFGRVYRAFRRGVLQDDDEVCVLHAVPELGFEPLSEAMVNIRYSLKMMRRRRLIDRDAEFRITSRLKELHFSKRVPAAIGDAFEEEFGQQGAAKFDLYERTKVDIKALDADLMLEAVLSSSVASANNDWEFPVTSHWLQQFVAQDADIPPICRWHPNRRQNSSIRMQARR